MVTLALVQAPSGDNVRQNLALLRHFSEAAAARGCQVVCFPEAFLTGYCPEDVRRDLPEASVVLGQVRDAAQSLSIDILTGFQLSTADGRFLVHGLFRRDGRMDFYRKTHLGKREGQYFTPGDTLPVFSLSCGLPIGIALCVETHFPELLQTLSLKGAQLIFAPHAVPRRAGDRRDIWGKYIPCRSYDNRVFLACCNQWDADRFGGGCLVTGPEGSVRGECFDDSPGLLTVSIHPEEAAQYRQANTALHHRYYPGQRRRELYL